MLGAMAGGAPAGRPVTGPTRRRAARVVLLDDRDRFLLLCWRDRADPARGTWWLTPGGGIEAGESPPQAALRELVEETGIRDARLGPCLWTRSAAFTFEGVAYEQREWYFAARTAGGPVAAAGFTDLERRSAVGHRWWTAGELRSTDQVVYPPLLASLVTSLLRDGPPTSPVEIG